MIAQGMPVGGFHNFGDIVEQVCLPQMHIGNAVGLLVGGSGVPNPIGPCGGGGADEAISPS